MDEPIESPYFRKEYVLPKNNIDLEYVILDRAVFKIENGEVDIPETPKEIGHAREVGKKMKKERFVELYFDGDWNKATQTLRRCLLKMMKLIIERM